MTDTQVGQRVALVHSNDPHTKLKQGDTGTVRFIDDLGTVHVKWDNGAALGLIEADGDRWVVIAPARQEAAPPTPARARPDYDPKTDWPERYQDGPIS